MTFIMFEERTAQKYTIPSSVSVEVVKEVKRDSTIFVDSLPDRMVMEDLGLPVNLICLEYRQY